MLHIKKKYIVDENNNRMAVQLEIDTYNKIERLLEDYALGKLMEENDDDDNLNLEEARVYYKKLKKADWKLG